MPAVILGGIVVSWPLILSENLSPIGSATGDIITYILGYGVLGVATVLFVFRVIVPAKAIDTARADLVKENERLIAEKTRAEEQRDAALQIAQTQIVPLLASFTATTTALLPLLQDLVSMREDLRASRGLPPSRPHGSDS